MTTSKLLVIPVAVMLIVTAIGCDENENQRLADMAERHLRNQAEQNRRMADLQKEVAEGARRLVEADAQARKEMVVLQREVGRQRDALEAERRDLAAKRRLDPLLAAAITHIGLLLVCLLPLLLCWHLLRRPAEPTDDRAVAELLLEDLVTDRPLLLPPPTTRRALALRDDDDAAQNSPPERESPAD